MKEEPDRVKSISTKITRCEVCPNCYLIAGNKEDNELILTTPMSNHQFNYKCFLCLLDPFKPIFLDSVFDIPESCGLPDWDEGGGK